MKRRDEAFRTVREHGEHEINQWIDAGLGGKMEGWGENSVHFPSLSFHQAASVQDGRGGAVHHDEPQPTAQEYGGVRWWSSSARRT